MHTKASDGTNTIRERVEQAKNQGLQVIAITDHDVLNGKLGIRSFKRGGIEVITGAEIKCQINGVGIEILGYFLDPREDELQELLMQNNRFRKQRMKKMAAKVNELAGSDISFEKVVSRADGNPGRPHLAAEMVENNVVENEAEAFNDLIGEDCPAYVPTEKLRAEKVIQAVHDNGGAAVLAHPGRDLEKDSADKIVRKLQKLGLDGLEVEYTYRHKLQQGYDIDFTEVYASELAEKYDLISTGGSDCHGEDTSKFNIGKVKLSVGQVEKLRKCSEKYRN